MTAFIQRTRTTVPNGMIERTKDFAWKAFLNAVPCDLSDTIVVSGVTRSGTSWLMELVRTLPGYKSLGEPLAYELDEGRPDHVGPYLRPGRPRDEKEAALRRILEGRIRGGWRVETSSVLRKIRRHVTRRKLVVKFVHGNRVLQWMANTFDVREILLVVRHPCAVVASMKKYGAWYYATPTGEAGELEHLLENLPGSIADDIRSRVEKPPESKEEMLALRWSIDHYLPFFVHEDAGYPWTLVPYERLVASGPEELGRIFATFEEDVPAEAWEHLNVPSRSARRTGVYAQNARKQLAKWRERLAPDEVDDILRIAHAFDLDFYDESLEPDYQKLMRFQRSDAEETTKTRHDTG